MIANRTCARAPVPSGSYQGRHGRLVVDDAVAGIGRGGAEVEIRPRPAVGVTS